MKRYFEELFDYDAQTGILSWKVPKGVKVGTQAGCVEKFPRYKRTRYRRVVLDGKRYMVHRIIATMFLGLKFSNRKIVVDHINGDERDNRLINLRLATNRQNMQNQKRHRDGKMVGASYDKNTGKWRTCLGIKGKTRHFGSHETELKAHEKYLEVIASLKKPRSL